jgi:hypothetical protein
LFLPWKGRYQQSSWWVVSPKHGSYYTKTPLTKFNMIFNPKEGRNDKRLIKKKNLMLMQPISHSLHISNFLFLFMFE